MSARTRLAVVFGGMSPEHEVSVTSARSVMREADAERFEVIPFGISKRGRWLTPEETRARLARVEAGDTRDIGEDEARGLLASADVLAALDDIDVAFPIVHGTFGEDGTLQGFLELAGIPYVGSGVAASAIGLDKELMRAVFAQAGLPQAPYTVLRDASITSPDADCLRGIEREIGYPCFVKPANGGSSVGVSKARSREDLGAALVEAGRHDRKVLVEAFLEGQEVECAVLGNERPEASPIGEITPRTAEFYTYEAKYLDDSTDLTVPARLDAAVAAEVQSLSLRAYRAMDCAGLARVDFFVTADGPRVLEINTLPGFTPISMYPRLWGEAGVPYSDLISRLVDLAFERHERDARRGGGQ
ncbi:MAG: D-alanine--D-alanine ligase family protein [Dehalococcoidia bacterium]